LAGSVGLHPVDEHLDGDVVRISSRMGEVSVAVEGSGSMLVDNFDEVDSGKIEVSVTSEGRPTPLPFAFRGPPMELCFLNLVVGERSGGPTRWALVSGELLTVQAYGGRGWARFSTGISLTRPITPAQRRTLVDFFEIARRLVVGDRGTGPRRVDHRWPYWSLRRASAAMSAELTLGALLGVFVDPGQREARRVAKGFVERFETTELFQPTGKVVALDPVQFLVVHLRKGEPYWEWATCSMARTSAGFASLSGRLDVVVHTVEWPGSVLDAAKLLPDSWATLELTVPRDPRGSPGTLSRLPPWGHEDRGPYWLRFQMTLADLEDGAVEDWARHLEVFLQSGHTSPYR
jgi:hypothetical protein